MLPTMCAQPVLGQYYATRLVALQDGDKDARHLRDIFYPKAGRQLRPPPPPPLLSVLMILRHPFNICLPGVR